MRANTETEQWFVDKLIAGVYELTDDVELISKKFNRPLKKELLASGYHRWRTRGADGKSRYILVHRLMYIWFVEDLTAEEQVNHIDNNRINNKIDNLEKATSSTNQIHSVLHGNHKHKLNPEVVMKIYTLHKKDQLSAELRKGFCALYNIQQSIISEIINGNRWVYITENYNEDSI